MGRYNVIEYEIGYDKDGHTFKLNSKVVKCLFIFLVTILFGIIPCKCNFCITNNVEQKYSFKDTTDTLSHFVSKIYEHNFVKTKTEVLDSLYLSSEMLSLEEKIKMIDSDVHFNHWIDDEFADAPSFKIDNVVYLSDTISTVKVIVSNGDNKSDYQLYMVLEKNNWKVDDFVHDTFTEKANIRHTLGLDVPLQGLLYEYSLKFCDYSEHTCVLNLYKNKNVLSAKTFEKSDNIRLTGISDTINGFNVYFDWGHGKNIGNTVFVFIYLKGDFYLNTVIQYHNVEVKDGFDLKKTEKRLETPILFQDVDFDKYVF